MNCLTEIFFHMNVNLTIITVKIIGNDKSGENKGIPYFNSHSFIIVFHTLSPPKLQHNFLKHQTIIYLLFFNSESILTITSYICHMELNHLQTENMLKFDITLLCYTASAKTAQPISCDQSGHIFFSEQMIHKLTLKLLKKKQN